MTIYKKTQHGSVLSRVKTGLILTTLAVLSGCSQLPSLPFEPAQQTQAEPTENQDVNIDQQASTAETPELSPEQALALSLHKAPDLFAGNKKLLASDIKESMRSVMDAKQAGNFEVAKNDVDSIINSELNLTSNVLVVAGDIYLALADADDQKGEQSTHLETAKAHYSRALEINEHNAKAANRLAKLLRQKGNFEQAVQLYTKAIASQPAHANSYRNRAVLNDLYLNRKSDALRDYQTYAALLNYQQENLNNTPIALSEEQSKALKKDIKMVGRWLADVQRQVNALARNKSENSNGS